MKSLNLLFITKCQALLILVLLIVSSFFAGVVRSQDFDPQMAFNEYLSALDLYRKEYAEYQKARDFYLQTKTLGLKENARIQTYELLTARDELLTVYMTALRISLTETPYHPGAERGDILTDLEGDGPWYRNHKSVYNRESDTLETLFEKGKETKEHFDNMSARFIYRALAIISFSKYLDIKSLHEHIYWPLKAEAETKSGTERELLNRWITDIDKEFQKVTDVENAVKIIRLDFKDNDKKPKEIYSRIIDKLDEGRDSMLAINGFLGEMSQALK